MPQPRRTALIFVSQDWFNSSLAHLLPPRPRAPNAEVHQLQTDLWEQADQGLWLKDVRETRLRRQDGSAVAPLRFSSRGDSSSPSPSSTMSRTCSSGSPPRTSRS